jgi:hypothetical protein
MSVLGLMNVFSDNVAPYPVNYRGDAMNRC